MIGSFTEWSEFRRVWPVGFPGFDLDVSGLPLVSGWVINASSGVGYNYTRMDGSPTRGGISATSYKVHQKCITKLPPAKIAWQLSVYVWKQHHASFKPNHANVFIYSHVHTSFINETTYTYNSSLMLWYASTTTNNDNGDIWLCDNIISKKCRILSLPPRRLVSVGRCNKTNIWQMQGDVAISADIYLFA